MMLPSIMLVVNAGDRLCRVWVQLRHVAQPGAFAGPPVAYTGVGQLQAVLGLLAMDGGKGDVVWWVPVLSPNHLHMCAIPVESYQH